MGETDFSAAEENPQENEPPLGAYHGATTQQHLHQHHHHHSQQVSREDGNDRPLAAWHCQSAAQVAQTLEVDLRYDFHSSYHRSSSLTHLSAMGSASNKRNLAFGSMDLTRLRELKGYPCGRFS